MSLAAMLLLPSYYDMVTLLNGTYGTEDARRTGRT